MKELLSKQPRRLGQEGPSSQSSASLCLQLCFIRAVVPTASRLVLFPGPSTLLPYHPGLLGGPAQQLAADRIVGSQRSLPRVALLEGGVGRDGKEEASHSWGSGRETRNDKAQKRKRPQAARSSGSRSLVGPESLAWWPGPAAPAGGLLTVPICTPP